MRRAHGADRQKISIHALREEGDDSSCNGTWLLMKFQSTPSARRATGHQGYVGLPVRISIHALREEGDVEQQDR